MKLEQIEISIGADGKVQIGTAGFSGDKCLEATRALEALLGGQLLTRDRTAESYDVPVQTAEQIRIGH